VTVCHGLLLERGVVADAPAASGQVGKVVCGGCVFGLSRG